ncbi:MAG: SDR family oxidoreductase [Verrucomicrobiae bacterium]|nr:SDR family oxidoreductase [Verrucomicrobiae bacterium]
MQLSLHGKSAVIVGAARGIGRAIAEAFAMEGANVALIDRDPEVESTAAEIGTGYAGKNAWAVADVASETSLREAVDRVTASMNSVDHVVFAAGIGSGKFGFPFTNLEPGDWRKVLDVNLMGAVHTAHAFAPRLIQSATADPLHGATFQILVSVAGQIGSQTDPPYSAAKAAQINFMQCLAKDLAPHGVRANAISPGMVKTALNESVWAAGQASLPESEQQSYEDWATEKIRKISPLGRWQEPAEFGAVSVFLASPHARNITGQVINVDGGQVMHS